MSFWLYEKCGDAYRRLRALRLSGTDGIVARWLEGKDDLDTPYAWTLDPAAIHVLCGLETAPEACVVVVDLLPGSLMEVCLYEVTCVRGCSGAESTDLVLGTRPLFERGGGVMAEPAKRAFSPKQAPSTREAFEALKLTGGTFGGRFLWGRPAMDIGAAVCPPGGAGAAPQAAG